LSLLSLGGLPPFLGFFPKWLIIELLVSMKIFYMLLFILFFTLLTLYFYLRISYAALIINHLEINWSFKIYYQIKNQKTLIVFSFLSLFGLLLINVIFYFF
jgi:NADH-ubiquinone oxidoreductase chain 2